MILKPPGAQAQPQASQAQIESAARLIARTNYPDYTRQFLYPSTSLMIKSGLWLELEAVIGFIVGLGLGSLTGQRTVTVIVLIVLEVILTPILSRARIPHMINLQRGVVGLATAHLAPGGLPVLGGGGGGPGGGSRESRPDTRVHHRGGLRHRRLAGRLVDPRRVANDDPRRLRLDRPLAHRRGRHPPTACGGPRTPRARTPPAAKVRFPQAVVLGFENDATVTMACCAG